MPRTPKTVSFSIPGTSSSSQPIAPSPIQPQPPLSTTTTTTISTHQEDDRRSLSPAPDLVADIINRPKTVYSAKIHGQQQPDSPSSNDAKSSPNNQRPTSRPSSELGQKSKKSPVPSYVRIAHRNPSSSSSMRGKSPVLQYDERLASPASIARDGREKTNSVVHQHVRSMKQDVSRLREHLLKVEEEIKNLNRGRRTLEMSVLDLRKCLSVNQQSISTQQKKSSRGEEDASIKLLREESRVLSMGKRSIEQHLQVVKAHLLVLDTTRRNIKTTIASFSSSLDMDAQNFKVYRDRSRIVRSDHTSQQKQCQSKSPGDEAGRLCSKATEVVGGSKAIRAEIKSRVVSVQASKTETHKKTSDAISRNMQEAKSKKRDMILERGEVRMAQNSTLHRLHEEEIALGIALGPVSDKHRSVSEKVERPLSQMRPGSAAEERENFRHTKQILTRQLSASSDRASLVSSTDKRLAHQLREGSQSVFLDSQTLRVRRMSLDNRFGAVTSFA